MYIHVLYIHFFHYNFTLGSNIYVVPADISLSIPGTDVTHARRISRDQELDPRLLDQDATPNLHPPFLFC